MGFALGIIKGIALFIANSANIGSFFIFADEPEMPDILSKKYKG